MVQRHRSKSGRAGGRRAQAEIGTVARLVDRAFDDPAASGGLFVLTLTIMAIMSNAMFLQPVSHPRPLFQMATQPAVAAEPAPVAADAPATVAVPLPRTRADAPVIPLDVALPSAPPAPVEAPATAVVAETAAPAPVPVASTPVAVDPQRTLILDIQRELARIGLYSGAIDGIVGERTRAAVTRYQAAAGIEVTGELDQNLLTLLTTPSGVTPPLPVGTGAALNGTDSITTSGTPRTDIAELVELERKSESLAAHARLTQVQAALNKIGYGPLVVDGSGGPETTSAIRRFELDNGLDISGGLSDALVARLIAIGAMAPG